MARVLWRDAQGKEGAVELTAHEIQIGRAVDCAIRTDDAMVSRHHARLYWAGTQYYLEDLGSANGVFYKEQRVSRHPLQHGDAIRCGSLWLRFIDSPPGYSPQPHQPGAPPPGYPRPPETALPQPPTTQQPVQPVQQHVHTPQFVYRPPSEQMPAAPPTPQPQPQPAPAPPAPASSSEAEEEVRRLQRRVEQLQTELRFYRGGQGSEAAKRMEELEDDNAKLEREMSQLKAKAKELEAALAEESGDTRLQRADELAAKTGETVQSLNDVLSNLRINVMAAEGEFEQFAHQIPRASFELIREALRSSADDVDSARELLRTLRELADG